MSKGVLFATYNSLIAKKKRPRQGEFLSRFDQLVNWFGKSYDGNLLNLH